MIKTTLEESLEKALAEFGMPLGERKTFSDVILEKSPEVPEPDEIDYESLEGGQKFVYNIFYAGDNAPLFERTSVIKSGFCVRYIVHPDDDLKFEINPQKVIDERLSKRRYESEAVEVRCLQQDKLDDTGRPPFLFSFEVNPSDSKVIYDYEDDSWDKYEDWHNEIISRIDSGKFKETDIAPAVIEFLRQRIKP